MQTQKNHHDNAKMVFGSIIGAAVLILVVFVLATASHAESTTDPLPKWRVVYAIIGEGEGEGLDGMKALACAIQARRTLRGVYGEKSSRVLKHLYSTRTLVHAIQAYEESLNPANCLYMEGATGWGTASDIAEFKRHGWWAKCRIVKVVGRHYFYAEKP
jgi:hypothetical protein